LGEQKNSPTTLAPEDAVSEVSIKALGKSHQRLFAWWLSVDSCARIDPESSVAELA
jgi:hypothetical protein